MKGRHMISRVAFVLAFVGSCAGLAQSPVTGSRECWPTPPGFAGAPYSADETVTTLASGARIAESGPFSMRSYRDSRGRTRRDQLASVSPNGEPSAFLIEIRDPEARLFYCLDVPRKVAHRYALPPMPPPRAGARVVVFNGPGTTTVSLGTDVIEGLQANGARVTRIVPAGQVGNDRSIATVTETWTSPDLPGVTLLTKLTDPRIGETTHRLVNLSRVEPDAGLFQPPPDYACVDETERVKIQFTYYPPATNARR